MIIVTWNIRGLNKAHKQKELKNFLNVNKVDVMGCLETRIKQHKAQHIQIKIVNGWNVQYNYSKAANGRIWLLWKPHIQLQVSQVSDQFIQCFVEDPNSHFKTHLSIIYSQNDGNQ